MFSWELDASCGMFCLDLCIFLGCGDGLVLEDARRVLFGRGASRLKSCAVIERGFGRGLVNRIGVLGAGRICGSLKGRWNPD